MSASVQTRLALPTRTIVRCSSLSMAQPWTTAPTEPAGNPQPQRMPLSTVSVTVASPPAATVTCVLADDPIPPITRAVIV